MESTDSSSGTQQPNLPPGFRFHPTDEELVIHYLKKKAASAPLPVAIIAEVDLYKFDPWELPAKATFGEQEWYFFSPRDRKYPNGARPNRAATSGYWKATGTDKPVLTSGGTHKVGVKKALVFYGGKPPKGIKTNWIMHEYRLAENQVNSNKPPGCDIGKKNSLRLDDWVLCRIYKKNNTHRQMDHHDKDDCIGDMLTSIPPSITVPKATNYSALLGNDHNLFEGIMNNNGADHHLAAMSNTLALKRTLPSSLYWNEEDQSAWGKRLHVDNSDGSNDMNGRNGDGNNSIVTLLSQLPQHQQTMLGSLGDGVFRQSFQLPGMNSYT